MQRSSVLSTPVALALLVLAPAATAAPAAAPAAAAAVGGGETSVTTAHTVPLRGRPFAYRATAGTLTLRNAKDEPQAAMFYVAYTATPAGGGERPVTFLFNGGPGSASLWLHLGSFGPQRLVFPETLAAAPAPYRVIANPETLLDQTDLVFLDAVGTGYSRALPGTDEAAFYSVDADLDAFARAIVRYLTLNRRWNAPKYLFGESYGATRAAALLSTLQARGVEFNGAILLSSILNFASYAPGLDQGSINFLPSLAAAAWFHHRVTPRSEDLPSFLDEVRQFAQGPYAAALDQGDALPAEEAGRIADRLAGYTGLDAADLKRMNLRIDADYFCKALLRDRGQVIGRLDARVTGVDADPAGDAPTYEPAEAAVAGAFTAASATLLARDLQYESPLDYRVTIPGLDHRWDWHHRAFGDDEPQTTPDVALDLAAALRANPKLKILSLNGYFDLVTPFFATEYDLNHMLLPPTLRDRVSLAYYPSGHMAYLNPQSLAPMRAELARFYSQSSQP